jgi:hypothetical protein
MAGDDSFLATVRYAPLLFVLAGILVVVWLARQRLPHELQPDVLAALSETEALPPLIIRQRPPLAHQDIDLETLMLVLERLCCDGLAVRWYEVVEVPDQDSRAGQQWQPVYRRVRGALERR